MCETSWADITSKNFTGLIADCMGAIHAGFLKYVFGPHKAHDLAPQLNCRSGMSHDSYKHPKTLKLYMALQSSYSRLSLTRLRTPLAVVHYPEIFMSQLSEFCKVHQIKLLRVQGHRYMHTQCGCTPKSSKLLQALAV